ncbi:MAG: MgtC/SapB family protein [Clostridium sp.]|uniref:MgtC/SapB family protein n=1 Tax=Clostridium sp. TaxID=1506 RepID=UPI0025BADC81|nr:MgtC/SapB family protein [Clostridium sp.]MCF0146981.1 MgtC/SapB family protein [Clostridium sp.]
MSEFYAFQLNYLLRILIAALCGLAIGLEREFKMKDAGIRTHFIVAIGSALIMIVSKYGFTDQIGWSNLSVDPGRTAAQVVSGVGFIGAGLIFLKERSIIGLTTAAGVWTTAGIGLAIGSGLYIIGLGSTVFIILGQLVLHRKTKWLAPIKTQILNLQIEGNSNSIKDIKDIFEKENLPILKFKGKYTNNSNALTDLKLEIKVDDDFDNLKLLSILQDIQYVKSIEF